MGAAAPEMRRHLLVMIGIVVVLDAVAIGAYYLLDLRSAAPHIQYVFTAVWTVLTLLVVLRGMGRVRAARLRARR